MTKMHKIRQRYIIFEIFSLKESEIDEKKLIRVMWQKLQQLFGEQKSFKAGLWIIYWDSIQSKGILRVDHLLKSEILTVFAFMDSIDKLSVIVHSRKITGTIKKAKKIYTEIFNLPILNS